MSNLICSAGDGNSESGSGNGWGLHKIILLAGESLLLAVRAVVCTASGEEHAADGRSTNQAGLAGAHIDPVFELEEASDAIGVDIV